MGRRTNFYLLTECLEAGVITIFANSFCLCYIHCCTSGDIADVSIERDEKPRIGTLLLPATEDLLRHTSSLLEDGFTKNQRNYDNSFHWATINRRWSMVIITIAHELIGLSPLIKEDLSSQHLLRGVKHTVQVFLRQQWSPWINTTSCGVTALSLTW